MKFRMEASPWEKGKGDVARTVATAAWASGLKFGMYLSPTT
jgi:alpha-L-fucosidase